MVVARMNYFRPVAVVLFDLTVAPLLLLGVVYALHYGMKN